MSKNTLLWGFRSPDTNTAWQELQNKKKVNIVKWYKDESLPSNEDAHTTKRAYFDKTYHGHGEDIYDEVFDDYRIRSMFNVVTILYLVGTCVCEVPSVLK